MSSKLQAIQAALQGNWDEAISQNLALLKESPNDTDTLNRIAFAYTITGKLKEAKETYRRVLTLDNKNPIALKNLQRLIDMAASDTKQRSYKINNLASLFLEEQGKTKVIDLINIADKKIIAHQRTGDILTLTPKRFKIFLYDMQKQYVGMLPDDIGRRIIEFINGNYTFTAYIKYAQGTKVTVFVKEINRSNNLHNQPTFLGLHVKQKGESATPKNHQEEDVSEEDTESAIPL